MNLPTCIIAAPPSGGGLLSAAFLTPVIGFIGVILTLLWTAWRSREDRKEAAQREASVLRAALLAHMRNMRRILKAEIDYINDKNHQYTLVPLLDFFSVYRNNLAKIGLLTPAEVDAVADAYFDYEERAGYIAKFADAPADRLLGTPVPVDFDKKCKSDLLRDLHPLIGPTEKAIIALEQRV